MNGEYYGSYFLCEHVRVGETRVNIDDLEANEDAMHETQEPFITGGYLLSLEPYGNEEKKSLKQKSNTFLIESPSFEDYYNETQYNYIKIMSKVLKMLSTERISKMKRVFHIQI